ncbi:phosphoenolpyruvate carboxykinase [Methylocystis sp. JAN1]|uniref:phosphoenolpyruvate carboxykinase n=1 Tax=Methylocystis sp. JAN1 TaxID=3397211 RepID=UPI003FA30018
MTAQSRVTADRTVDLFALDAFPDLEAPRLYEEALRRKEGLIARSGALIVETAPHTGRSPADKFIVRDALTDETVWWDNNQPMTPEQFSRLYADMSAHARGLDLFAQNLQACADPKRRLDIRVYSEFAWHALFIRNLLIRPPAPGAASSAPDLTIVALPSFRADPARHGCRSETVIALDFSRRLALIGGTRYAGEIKKSVFTFLNFLMPAQGVLPMHCAANDHASGAAIFFGLSGTGKTTLSADASRMLIGDDEHGWDENGVFNFEGGCYAKAIRLSAAHEPEIHAAANRFGVVLENVGFDPATRSVDFDDDSKTENTRIAYPLDFIPNASAEGRASHPKNVVMLTCDAFGVLPPIAKLDSAQAMYHFLSGYTARVAGTENGVRAPQAVFSTCFGAPFMPRRPAEYGNMLRERIVAHDAGCWLVNTGWTGGAYGEGGRMPIQVTRALLRAALDGSLEEASCRRDPFFGFETPLAAPGVDPGLLDPAKTWASPARYEDAALRLAGMFHDNFKSFASSVGRDVCAAGPRR